MSPRRALAALAAVALTTTAAACNSGRDDVATDDETTLPPSIEAPPTTTAPATAAPTTEASATTVAPTTVATTVATTAARLATTTAASTTTTAAPTTTLPAPTTTLPATTTTIPAPARMPLTGVPLGFGQTPPDRSALVVKIDNVDEGRNQTGLNLADVVFEEVVEGQATRFAAVFHSQGANPVGPIRSGRTQDIDLLSGLNSPIFVWSGGNGNVTRAIEDSDFVSMSHVGAATRLFYRSSDRPKPHNLYSNTDPFWQQLGWSIGRPVPLFTYLPPGQAMPGAPAGRLDVQMGKNPVRWEYDPASGLYLRSQNGRAHELAEGRASADNVVVLLCNYRPSVADARSPEAVTVGNGLAYVLSDGMVQIGGWSRADNRAPINLVTADGSPMPLAPGRTWVELADTANHATTTG